MRVKCKEHKPKVLPRSNAMYVIKEIRNSLATGSVEVVIIKRLINRKCRCIYNYVKPPTGIMEGSMNESVK